MALRRLIVMTVLTALACGAWVAVASAATLHVAPFRLLKGSTTLPCAADKPCNLAFALANAGPGDDVAMAPGDYVQPVPTPLLEPGPYTAPLDVGAGVVLHGDPGAPLPVIHARVTSTATAAIQLLGGATMRDVALEATPDPGVVVGYGVLVSGTALLERVHVVVTGTAGTLMGACTTIGGTVRDSACVGTGAAGRVDAVLASSTGNLTYRLLNVTAVSTTPEGYGVRLGTSSYAATMNATNVIARGATADLGVSVGLSGGSAILVVDHSNWVTQLLTLHTGSTGQIAPGAGDQTGATAAMPLFVDAASGDFREAPGSPTIDAGAADPSNGPLALGGAPRTVGAATDIGADEFVPAPPAADGGTTSGVGTTAGGGGGGTAGAGDTVAPRLAGLGLARSFARARGTTIRFTLSEPATVMLIAARRAPGRRVGATCRPITRANRARPRCVRLVVLGRLVVHGHAGLNRIAFHGRLAAGRLLHPGTFLLIAHATDAAGNPGAPRSVRFVITR